jgi:ATP-dependent Clp protease adaptor protein ClpS
VYGLKNFFGSAWLISKYNYAYPMSNLFDIDFDLASVEETEREAIKPPSRYKVILNNDDYTPMDFVVEVLMKFFNMDFEKANQVMTQVHFDGFAVVGLFTAEIAEMKVMQTNNYARENQHPLLCTMEKA